MKTVYEKGIDKIRRLDARQKLLQKEADLILSTSGYGQAPPIYHRTLDKAIAIAEQKAKIWNEQIRSYLIPNHHKTFWQRAVEFGLPVTRFGGEELLNFYAEDIEGLL